MKAKKALKMMALTSRINLLLMRRDLIDAELHNSIINK